MLVENTTADAILRGVLLAVLALGWLNLLIRINGLRSLSKMTNFDFVTTIALGSLLAGAGQASEWTGFAQPMSAMAGLFVAQFIAARLRKRSDVIEDAIGNAPVLLMRDGEMHRDTLSAHRISEADLMAKLREANVLDLAKVRAVVLETTGDVSVLHGDKLDSKLCEDVKEA